MNIKKQIIDVIQKGKIAGSWLVSGEYGVGKKKFASELASFLTTGEWKETYQYNPNVKWVECGLTEDAKKEIQKMILAGKSVEENEKTANRKQEITIDDIRSGIQFLSLKPAQNEYRILIINLAEDMNRNAANALLKVLEEPYPQSVLILLTQNTGKLLPTICSRCRKIVVPKLKFSEITEQLKQLYPQCKDVELIAELSNGSIGLAREIYNQNGLELYQKLTSLLVPFSQVDIEKLNDFADFLTKNEKQYDLFCTFLLNRLASYVKEYAQINRLKTERFIDIFDETTKEFDLTSTLYLDKKQVIISKILSLCEVL